MMHYLLVIVSQSILWACDRVKGLRIALQALKLAGVDGVTVDLWWGAVGRHGPLVRTPEHKREHQNSRHTTREKL